MTFEGRAFVKHLSLKLGDEKGGQRVLDRPTLRVVGDPLILQLCLPDTHRLVQHPEKAFPLLVEGNGDVSG